MALIAHTIGQATQTEWVWWLAPLTVAVNGIALLRAGVGDDTGALSPFDDHLVAELDPRVVVASSAVVTAMAAYGAFTGNRMAIVTGAVLAMVGTALEQAEHGTRWPA
jgi:hypothetical protein